MATTLHERFADDTGAGMTLLDRAALRFLLNHHLGRLVTEDPLTGEPHVSPVHYAADETGSLVTHLSAESPHANAIRRGGRTMLSVRARHPEPLRNPTDEHGLPTADALWQVQAELEPELIQPGPELEQVLQRQINAVLDPLPQGDRQDPLYRAARSELDRLVGVRLTPLKLRAYFHEHTAAGV
jgi:hypothetical protein